MRFTCKKGRTLELSTRPHVMGILNVTPDSFSDGGRFVRPDAAIAHAVSMARDGADIIDVGGISTRPGSRPVNVQEELDRTVPVIEALARELDTPISIDTYRSDVAREALLAGASIVNDISGLGFDPSMASTVAQAGAPVILMHIKGTPLDMQIDPSYEALMPEIMDCLRASAGAAIEADIREIALDPGIGFGKTFDHNLQIMNRLDEIVAMGRPVLVGPSRKAFLGAIQGGAGPEDRLEGTAAMVAIAVMKGAHIVRVHDVRHMARVARAAWAVRMQSVQAGGGI